ncbi:MAG TPA: hypothetical protein VHE14_07515 [Solirubrobacteraceae bacterium]|nr:hypothetical protein [Solirubrobacteraceae bacterium]
MLIATAMWREATDEPLPKVPPGDPASQIEQFELQVVDLLCASAEPSTARDVADKTWDLVHDRPDSDPVKQRVVLCHDRLTKLGVDPPLSEG